VHRLFKFPQMDFELAVWEMTHLLIAPKKVFKSIYYHKRSHCPSSHVR
jgi:UNC-50 family